RGADADELVVGAGVADRAAGVGAEADAGQVGGDRGAGPAAGPARRAGEVVRTVDLDRGAHRAIGLPGAHGVLRAEPGRELVEAGLAEDDRAGAAQAGDHEGVVGRLVVGQALAAGGGRHVGGVVVVLEDHRDAVEHAPRLPGRTPGVAGRGLGQ